MGLLVKICGLTTPEAAQATARAGADMAGFNFCEKSPRYLESFARAKEIAAALGPQVIRAAVTVDAVDATLEAIIKALAPQYIQLHGDETPARVSQVKARFSLPVIKACAISDQASVKAARLYEETADLLLFDAKPPKSGASRPGGLGETFDWSLLGHAKWNVPWLLAGGLTPENVGEAIARTAPGGVDVSSGVEAAPGIKSPELIERFVAAARSAG